MVLFKVVVALLIINLLLSCGSGKAVDEKQSLPKTISALLPFFDANNNGVNDDSEEVWQSFVEFLDQAQKAEGIVDLSDYLSEKLLKENTELDRDSLFIGINKAIWQGGYRYFYSLYGGNGAEIIIDVPKGPYPGFHAARYILENEIWVLDELILGRNYVIPKFWDESVHPFWGGVTTISVADEETGVGATITIDDFARKQMSVFFFDTTIDDDLLHSLRTKYRRSQINRQYEQIPNMLMVLDLTYSFTDEMTNAAVNQVCITTGLLEISSAGPSLPNCIEDDELTDNRITIADDTIELSLEVESLSLKVGTVNSRVNLIEL